MTKKIRVKFGERDPRSNEEIIKWILGHFDISSPEYWHGAKVLCKGKLKSDWELLFKLSAEENFNAKELGLWCLALKCRNSENYRRIEEAARIVSQCLLKEEDPRLLIPLIVCVFKISSINIREIFRFSSHESNQVRELSALALGRYSWEGWGENLSERLSLLLQLCADKNLKVQRRAVFSLKNFAGSLKDYDFSKRACEILAPCLNNRDNEISFAAAFILTQLDHNIAKDFVDRHLDLGFTHKDLIYAGINLGYQEEIFVSQWKDWGSYEGYWGHYEFEEQIEAKILASINAL